MNATPPTTISSPARGLAPVAADLLGARGARGALLHPAWDVEIVRRALAEPETFVRPPRGRREEEKARARRAVHSFFAEVHGERRRLYLKFFRVGGPKDVLEELVLGSRAKRSLEAGLEAERRGIPACIHLGASTAGRFSRFPKASVLLTLGVPHNRDVRTVLKHELPPSAGGARAEFLRALGRLAAGAHERGLVHGDFKIRNVFVLETSPPRLALIDFDRAHYPRADSAHALAGQVFDLKRLLQSLREKVERGEVTLTLRAYLRGRTLSRERRRRLMRRLRAEPFRVLSGGGRGGSRG